MRLMLACFGSVGLVLNDPHDAGLCCSFLTNRLHLGAVAQTGAR